MVGKRFKPMKDTKIVIIVKIPLYALCDLEDIGLLLFERK